jgi:hypothetical protein
MKASSCSCAAAFLLLSCAAIADDGVAPRREPLELVSPVQDKNFYLLSLVERTAEVKAILVSDAALAALARNKSAALHDAANACTQDLVCLTAPFRLSEAESSAAAEALRRLYRDHDSVREMVNQLLRRSGTYVRYHSQSGEQLLIAAWKDAVRGLNRIIDVYGEGKAPHYAAIDSAAFDVKTA